jgi:hypothetical protein
MTADPFADAPNPALRHPVVVAVVAGDYRASLVAIRDNLAQRLAECRFAKDAAPLAKQLCDVLAAIEAVPDVGKADVVDEIASQRAARRAAGTTA